MSGDFERFMQERTPSLLRLAWGLTGNQQDAEDLTQDALVRIHAKWRRVSRANDVTAYSSRVLVNCHLDNRRRHREQEVALLESDEPVSDRTSSIDDRLALRDAVSKLPIRQRTIVVLRFYEELSTGDISELMGIGESSVRSGLARAISVLEAAVAVTPASERKPHVSH